MVRGCKKSIIYIKNTESDLFSEAYFIIKEQNGAACLKEGDLVSEARKIAEQKAVGKSGFAKMRKRVRKKDIITAVSSFFAGALLTSLIFILVIII